MSRITLAVALSDGITQEDVDALTAAIGLLRGIEGVTANVADIGDRVAFQRMRNEVEAAVKAALDNATSRTMIEETNDEESEEDARQR